jgi:hypothetical protein
VPSRNQRSRSVHFGRFAMTSPGLIFFLAIKQGTKAPEWPEELNEPLTPEEEESTIFVQFPVDATLKNVKKTLQKTFMRLGTVVKVVAPYDPVRRKSRGIASITFVSWVGAKKSVQAPLIKMVEPT